MVFAYLAETISYYLGYYPEPDEVTRQKYSEVLEEIPSAHKKWNSLSAKLTRFFRKAKMNKED